MQAALGNPAVQEVLFDATLKYVLVVLASGTSQAQLTAIQPDYVRLKAAWPSKLAGGLIVSCAGRKEWYASSALLPCRIDVLHCARCQTSVRRLNTTSLYCH